MNFAENLVACVDATIHNKFRWVIPTGPLSHLKAIIAFGIIRFEVLSMSTSAMPPEALISTSSGFKQIRSHASSDKKGRVVLGKAAANKRYRAYENEKGQILLDPVIELSERELELLADPARLAEWNEAVRDVEAGRTEYKGSFSSYVE